MLKEQFLIQKQQEETIKAETDKKEVNEVKVTEQEINKSIKENPQGFLGWFEKLKDSISYWPKKFFENKTIRNAIIYASIPFSILNVSLPTRAEDVADEFLKTSKTIEKAEAENLEQRIRAKDLINIADIHQKELVAGRINAELNAFDKLSDVFNKAVSERINLFPKEVIEKTARGEKVFDFSGRMEAKIKEANQYFQEVSAVSDQKLREEMLEARVKKILEDGKLNIQEAIKILPDIILAQKISLISHEAGHEEEAIKQGAKSVRTSYNLFGGYTEYYGKIKNRAIFSAAGIKADKEFSEFLVNNLREQNAPNQLLAILALTAKSDGMRYALSTNFTEIARKHKGNDILSYAKETGVSVSELALGLTADFILDRDNWQLLKIVLGKEGVKIPRTTLAPMYELGEHGPIIGIKFKGIF